MKVFMTGATGTIGRHVVGKLRENGDHLRILVLPGEAEKVPFAGEFEIFPGSLDDREVLAKASKGVDIVLHIAGLPATVGNDPKDMFRVNTEGTRNVLEAALANRVRRFVYSSSVSVFTPHPFPHMWPITEATSLRAHGSDLLRNYGQSKIDAEDLLISAQKEQGDSFEYVILRPTTTYGPNIDYVERLVWHTMRLAILGRTRALQSSYMQWVHVTDVAEAIVLACLRKQAANEIFIVAGGDVITSQDTLDVINEMLFPDYATPDQWEQQQAANYGLRFSIDKAQELLGFVPEVRFRDGMREVLEQMNLTHMEMEGGWEGPAQQRAARGLGPPQMANPAQPWAGGGNGAGAGFGGGPGFGGGYFQRPWGGGMQPWAGGAGGAGAGMGQAMARAAWPGMGAGAGGGFGAGAGQAAATPWAGTAAPAVGPGSGAQGPGGAPGQPWAGGFGRRMGQRAMGPAWGAGGAGMGPAAAGRGMPGGQPPWATARRGPEGDGFDSFEEEELSGPAMAPWWDDVES